MKTTIYLLAIILFFAACNKAERPTYNSKWDIEISYIDGAIDTIHVESSSLFHLGSKMTLTDDGVVRVFDNKKYTVIATNVRSLEILKEEKTFLQ